MRSRSIALSFALLAATSGLHALAPSDRYVGETSIFSIANKTDVPGQTLAPGKYFILVVDQFPDRLIVRVENEVTKDHAIFLGVPQPALGVATARGPLSWKKGPNDTTAMRGFAFSPGSTVEFVYPKSQAVAIATRNAAKVIAVDPESEGMPQFRNMSKDDMRMVNLWALSLSTVGPSDKGPTIVAKKYESEQPSATQSAAVGDVPAAPKQHRDVASLETPQLGTDGNVTAIPAAKRKAVIAKLPHTASPVALIAFLGMFCLIGGGLLRVGSRMITAGANQG